MGRIRHCVVSGKVLLLAPGVEGGSRHLSGRLNGCMRGWPMKAR